MKVPILLSLQDRWRTAGLGEFLAKNGYQIVTRDPLIVLADADCAPSDTYSALSELRVQWPTAHLLIFVPQLRITYTLPCFAAGAVGILPADAEPATLLAALQSVRAGDIWAPRRLMADTIVRLTNAFARGDALRADSIDINRLLFTRAERRVLRALRDELSNKEIARLLHVTVSTIKFHVGRLLAKTGARNRHELRQLASKDRLAIQERQCLLPLEWPRLHRGR